MTPRDRTVPMRRAELRELHLQPPPRDTHRFRFIVDVSAILAISGLIFGGGVAWQVFLDDGKRLDDHDQEIRALTQLQQQQQQTLAALNQNVSDIKDSLVLEHRK